IFTQSLDVGFQGLDLCLKATDLHLQLSNAALLRGRIALLTHVRRALRKPEVLQSAQIRELLQNHSAGRLFRESDVEIDPRLNRNPYRKPAAAARTAVADSALGRS